MSELDVIEGPLGLDLDQAGREPLRRYDAPEEPVLLELLGDLDPLLSF